MTCRFSDYLSSMKAVITVSENALQNKDKIQAQLQKLVNQKELKGIIEYKPKSRKTTEVIRILRENSIGYQITFDSATEG